MTRNSQDILAGLIQAAKAAGADAADALLVESVSSMFAIPIEWSAFRNRSSRG